MNYWLKRGLVVAALGAGTLLGGAAMASAGEAPDDGGLVSAPVHVTDLTVDVLSSPGADGPGAADDRPAAATLVSVPVQVSGVDVDVLDAQGSGRPDQPADRH